jgi:hypothetical protein
MLLVTKLVSFSGIGTPPGSRNSLGISILTAMPRFGMSISTLPDDPKRRGYVVGEIVPTGDEV